jgi:hypothetical protein
MEVKKRFKWEHHLYMFDFQLLPLITAALVPLQVDIRGFRFPNMIESESCRKKQMKHSEVSKARQ